MTGRARGYALRPFPPARRIVLQALRAGRRIAPVYGLIECDVTGPLERLRAADPPPSLTAYVVASVARSVAAHPDVHAYRDWSGRLVIHRHVDVATMIEIPVPTGSFGLAHLVSDADIRAVGDITAEIREVQRTPNRSGSARALRRWARAGSRIPGLVPLMYWAMRKSKRVRRRVGTVSVSSIGMFGGGGGFGIGFPTILSVGLFVGGLSEKARVVDGRIEPRQILDLTVMVDHKVVDGAPAARFVADLRARLENGEELD